MSTRWPPPLLPASQTSTASSLTAPRRQTFLRLSQRTDGPLAVHCMAGVGRTGTFIGLSMTNTLASSPTIGMAARPAPREHRGPVAELPPGPGEAHQVPGDDGDGWGAKETANLAKPMTRGMDLRDKEQAELPLYPPPLLPPRPC
jgi:hypothetical protein